MDHNLVQKKKKKKKKQYKNQGRLFRAKTTYQPSMNSEKKTHRKWCDGHDQTGKTDIRVSSPGLSITLSHERLNNLSHTLYWKSLFSILGMSGCTI